MAAGVFHHFGVPTQRHIPGAVYIDGAKVHVTDPSAHPYNVEFVRFEPDSPMPDAVKKSPHAAFVVKDLDAAVKGRNVLVAPCAVGPDLRIAFIADGDAVIELMEMKQ